MTETRRDQTIRQLLDRLEELEARTPRPEEAGIVQIARDAIVEELSRVTREDWLAVYRRGDNLDAVSYAG